MVSGKERTFAKRRVSLNDGEIKLRMNEQDPGGDRCQLIRQEGELTSRCPEVNHDMPGGHEPIGPDKREGSANLLG